MICSRQNESLNPRTKYRDGKITPKKIGQFVTLWKRNEAGITTPYELTDAFDTYIINVQKGKIHKGQFIFPKEVLEEFGIIASDKSKGKRGFRIYPPWDKAINPQAIKTQKWQLEYFSGKV